MAINIQKEFNKKTFMGVAIGIATLMGSHLAQSFVPESLDTKKKFRPIAVPILVGIFSAVLIKQKEYKLPAIIGSAIMLLFGILKLLDEEKVADKKILSKLFGITLAGDRSELEFQNMSELKGFVDAATHVDGDGYIEIPSSTGVPQIHGEPVFYGEPEIFGESILDGDDEIHGEEVLYGETVFV